MRMTHCPHPHIHAHNTHPGDPMFIVPARGMPTKSPSSHSHRPPALNLSLVHTSPAQQTDLPLDLSRSACTHHVTMFSYEVLPLSLYPHSHVLCLTFTCNDMHTVPRSLLKIPKALLLTLDLAHTANGKVGLFFFAPASWRGSCCCLVTSCLQVLCLLSLV